MLLTRASYEGRRALRDDQVMNEALGRPVEFRSDTTKRRIASVGEALLRYLLYTDEAPLRGPVRGTSSFATDFQAQGPRDARGRSLRDLDLQRRLLKHPLSHLIYSPSFDALPAVAEAVEGRIPVLTDGGIRRGADVVKALALGASFCLIARPQLWGLAVAGEAGVRHVLELYRRETDRVMGLMGAKSIADLGPDCVMRLR